MKNVFILCAAIWYNDDKKREHQPKNIGKGIVLCGWRHHNCFQLLSEMFDKNEIEKSNIEQGFLTSDNTFVSRDVAYQIADNAGQLKGDTTSTILTSEDLY